MARHAKMPGWTLLLLLLGLAVTLAGSYYQESRRIFDIGDYSHVNIQQAEETFQSDASNQNLVTLIKALCFRQEVLGEPGWEGQILTYGRELYTRARDETVDLQAVDDEGVMTQVLSVLRKTGAHR